MATSDTLKWNVTFEVAKFDGPDADERARRPGATPDSVVKGKGNLLTTAGLDRLTSLLIAGGGQGYDNGNTRIGVGNDNTAAAVGDTDLGAAAGNTNRQFVDAEATYPSQSDGVVTVRSVFSTSVANFAWEEWGIDNGTTSGTTVVAAFLNHKVTSLGTKTNASAWTFTVTITLS